MKRTLFILEVLIVLTFRLDHASAQQSAPAPPSRSAVGKEGTPVLLDIEPIVPADSPVRGDPFVKGTPSAGGAADATDADVAADTSNYQMLLEAFDLSRADLAALMNEAGGDTALYRRTMEWMASNRIKLVQFSGHIMRHGQRTVLESIQEVRYATKFDAPIAEEGYAFPTNYETRNAGDTVEAELLVKEDQASMQVAINSIQLLRFEDSIGVSIPAFETRRLTTNVNLTLNSPRFLGTFSAPAGDTAPLETVRIAFLRLRRVPSPPPPPSLQEAKVEGPVNLRIEYSFFSIDRAMGRELLLANADPQKCYDLVRGMVVDNRARLEHVCASVTISGNRTVTEEVVEVRYATKFTAPRSSEPKGAATPSSPSSLKPGQTGSGQGAQGGEMKTPLPQNVPPKKAMIPAVGTAFETRNAGFTAEVEPVMSANGTDVDVALVPQFVQNLGALETTGIAKNYPAQPLFEARKFTGALTAPLGKQQFLSTYNRPGATGANGNKDDGRVILGFVRVVLVN